MRDFVWIKIALCTIQQGVYIIAHSKTLDRIIGKCQEIVWIDCKKIKIQSLLHFIMSSIFLFRYLEFWTPMFVMIFWLYNVLAFLCWECLYRKRFQYDNFGFCPWFRRMKKLIRNLDCIFSRIFSICVRFGNKMFLFKG